jgi:hypothetical protein
MVFPLLRGEGPGEQTKETRVGVTHLAGISFIVGYKGLSEPSREENTTVYLQLRTIRTSRPRNAK